MSNKDKHYYTQSGKLRKEIQDEMNEVTRYASLVRVETFPTANWDGLKGSISRTLNKIVHHSGYTNKVNLEHYDEVFYAEIEVEISLPHGIQVDSKDHWFRALKKVTFEFTPEEADTGEKVLALAERLQEKVDGIASGYVIVPRELYNDMSKLQVKLQALAGSPEATPASS